MADLQASRTTKQINKEAITLIERISAEVDPRGRQLPENCNSEHIRYFFEKYFRVIIVILQVPADRLWFTGQLILNG